MNDSFLRWQQMRLNQLSYVNYLIVVLSIGVIGFLINFIQSDNLTLTCFQKTLLWIGGFSELLSIGIGIFVSMNRLYDFRLTAKIARDREKRKYDNIEEDRKKSKKIGNRTWDGIIWQVLTFFIGFLSVLILVLIEFKANLI